MSNYLKYVYIYNCLPLCYCQYCEIYHEELIQTLREINRCCGTLKELKGYSKELK